MTSQRLHREHASLVSLVARLLDVLAVSLAAYLAYVLPDWPAPLDSQRYLTAGLLAALLVLLVFPLFHTYASWRGRAWRTQLRTVAMAWFTVVAILVFLAFITKTSALYSRQWLLLWAIGGLSSLIVFRGILGFTLRLMRLRGWNRKHIVIIGAGRLGQNVARRLGEAMASGLKVCAYLDDNPELHGKRLEGVEVMGDIDSLPEVVERFELDEVWIALPMRAEDRLKDVLHALRHSTVNIRYVPNIFGLSLINHSVSDIAGMPVLNLTESPMHGINWVVKTIEDKLLAALILVLVSPLFLVIAIGVKLSSPGPVFYRQERVSWNGRPFMMLKFRSMPVDAERGTGPTWAKPGENRATAFGAFLRKTSLDELPQFINVLKGDMSIVGPRPERPVFVSQFKEEIPDYMKKHLVKAGITGWAQINGWRGSTDLNRRIEYDLQYIENWSLWLDLKIIFLTLFKGFVHKNAY